MTGGGGRGTALPVPAPEERPSGRQRNLGVHVVIGFMAWLLVWTGPILGAPAQARGAEPPASRAKTAIDDRCERADRDARIQHCRHAMLRQPRRSRVAKAALAPKHPLFLVDRIRAIPAAYPLGERELWRSCRDAAPPSRRDLVCLPVPYTNRWTALRRLAWEGGSAPRPKRTHDGLAVGLRGKVGIKALMDAALVEAGAELFVTSAFRPYAVQRAIFEDHVQREMAKGLDRAAATRATTAYSARPGHSEHQLGTTVDFTYRRPDGELSGFGGFMAYEMHDARPMRWLRANAHRFGVVQTYRHDRVAWSQYVWEPWHWRYVGVEAADAIHACDLGLSEFLEVLHGASAPPPFEHQRLVGRAAAAVAPIPSGPAEVVDTFGPGEPLIVQPGQRVSPQWWVTNLGGRQWDGVRLTLLWADAQWSPSRLPGATQVIRRCVPVWSEVTVNPSVQAPAQVGLYKVQWLLSTSDGDPLSVLALEVLVVAKVAVGGQ